MYFPEDIWREIKNYFVRPKMNIGDCIITRSPHTRIGIHNHPYEFYMKNKEGIIVSVTKDAFIKDRLVYNYCISMVDFNGDYALLRSCNQALLLHKLNRDVYEKLFMIVNFEDWWYGEHKDLYHSLIIEALTNF